MGTLKGAGKWLGKKIADHITTTILVFVGPPLALYAKGQWHSIRGALNNPHTPIPLTPLAVLAVLGLVCLLVGTIVLLGIIAKRQKTELTERRTHKCPVPPPVPKDEPTQYELWFPRGEIQWLAIFDVIRDKIISVQPRCADPNCRQHVQTDKNIRLWGRQVFSKPVCVRCGKSTTKEIVVADELQTAMLYAHGEWTNRRRGFVPLGTG